jgi:predicted membrane protein
VEQDPFYGRHVAIASQHRKSSAAHPAEEGDKHLPQPAPPFLEGSTIGTDASGLEPWNTGALGSGASKETIPVRRDSTVRQITETSSPRARRPSLLMQGRWQLALDRAASLGEKLQEKDRPMSPSFVLDPEEPVEVKQSWQRAFEAAQRVRPPTKRHQARLQNFGGKSPEADAKMRFAEADAVLTLAQAVRAAVRHRALDRRVQSAIKIQTAWRGFAARRTAVRLQELRLWDTLAFERRILSTLVYTALLLLIAGATYVSLVFGVRFAPEQTRAWLLTSCAAYALDIVAQEPIVILVNAMVLVLMQSCHQRSALCHNISPNFLPVSAPWFS